MSIITFMNKGTKENGQTLSIAAIASQMAIEHNYSILIISTDFNDKTMEDCFFNPYSNRNNIRGIVGNNLNMDISNGLEGLVRMFASNRADPQGIKSYTKPILQDRLDMLQAPKTVDYKEYANMSVYFSQIADIANSSYDMVLVDLSNDVPEESQKKVMDLSTVLVVGLNQNQKSLLDFAKLKQEDERFRRRNVLISIGRYNQNSKYTAKNVSRFLKEKNIPIVIPYDILFSDFCSEGRVIDYFLQMQGLTGNASRDEFFCSQVRDCIQKIEYVKQEQEYGIR